MTTSPFYTADHEAFREVVRRFVKSEIEPYAHGWDEAGTFPRELYEKAAAIGLLGLGFPEEYGGTIVDRFMWIVAVQELARAGAGGVSASLKSNSIGAPPIANAGSAELNARVLPDILSGKKISALAITEPGAARTSPTFAPPRAAMATAIWSTAKKHSSRPAYAPITSRQPCAPAAKVRAASAFFSFRATRPACHAPC